ncbi:hypothetical protein K523DRAFT_362775 [Schizophyllum commune Tattone D]|nr:hypothetical protein K523DRAFT_362775 [Schizophyllum commune Tattone D]
MPSGAANERAGVHVAGVVEMFTTIAVEDASSMARPASDHHKRVWGLNEHCKIPVPSPRRLHLSAVRLPVRAPEARPRRSMNAEDARASHGAICGIDSGAFIGGTGRCLEGIQDAGAYGSAQLTVPVHPCRPSFEPGKRSPRAGDEEGEREKPSLEAPRGIC